MKRFFTSSSEGFGEALRKFKAPELKRRPDTPEIVRKRRSFYRGGYYGAVDKDCGVLPATMNDVYRLDFLLGRHGAPLGGLASDRRAFSQLRQRCRRWLERRWEQHPDRHYYTITIISDAWVTSVRSPEIDLAQMQAVLQRALRTFDSESVLGRIEFQIARLHQMRKSAMVLMPHFHGVIETAKPLDRKAAVERLAAWESLRCADAPNVVIRRIGATDVDRMRAFDYPFKVSATGKRQVMKKGSKPRFRKWKRMVETRPGLCLRLEEVHSHFMLSELLIGVGVAAKARAELLAFTKPATQRFRSGLGFYELNVSSAWASLRKGVPKSKYMPVVVERRSANPHIARPLFPPASWTAPAPRRTLVRRTPGRREPMGLRVLFS